MREVVASAPVSAERIRIVRNLAASAAHDLSNLLCIMGFDLSLLASETLSEDDFAAFGAPHEDPFGEPDETAHALFNNAAHHPMDAEPTPSLVRPAPVAAAPDDSRQPDSADADDHLDRMLVEGLGAEVVSERPAGE